MKSPAIVLSPDDVKLARILHGWGYALILLAFLMPFLAALFDRASPAQVGGSLFYNLMALLVLGFIAWVTTSIKSNLVKAKARLVIGVLMCLFSGWPLLVTVSEDRDAEKYLRAMLVLRTQHTEQFNELDLRFKKVDMNSVLSVKNLTTTSGLATANATIAQYRALLAERRLLLQTYLLSLDRYLNDLPAGNFKTGVKSAVAAGKDATVKLYNDLDVSQTGLADATSAVLDWSAEQSKKLSLQAGQLQFTSMAQKTDFIALISKVGVAEAKVDEALAANANAQIAAQEQSEASMLEVEKLLRK
jgi:hypothetical protein